jgi:predicted kinase
MIILMMGLPGTGKSTLARVLAKSFPATILNRDEIRDDIFPLEDLDYSDEQNELASQVTYIVAEYILRQHEDRIIILDGRPYSRKEQIKEVQELAIKVKHPLKAIYCWAPDHIVRKRLQEDLSEPENMKADRTYDKYLRIKDSFDTVEIEYLKVDTSQPLEDIVPRAFTYLGI